MNIKLVRVTDPENFMKYEPLLMKISQERRARISRMRLPRMKTVSLVTELLIRSEVSKATGASRDSIKFTYGEHGKPLLDGLDLFFSVSHSGDLIAYADSSEPIGVDIQQIRKVDLKLATRFFTAEETRAIETSADPEHEFFRVWTLKEAYLKMLGTGLSGGLDSHSVLSGAASEISRTRSCGGYVLSVCCNDMGEMGYSGYGKELFL